MPGIPPEDGALDADTGGGSSDIEEQVRGDLLLPAIAGVRCPECSHDLRADATVHLTVRAAVALGDVQLFVVRPGAPLAETLDDVRRGLVRAALAQTGGNRARAAALLGLKPTTFYGLAQRLQL